MTAKRFTITQDFEEHHRQIRDNGKIIMGCFLEPQAEPIVKLLNELHEENQHLESHLEMVREQRDKQMEKSKALKKQLESEHIMLDNAILLERTRMGQNSLKQYKEAIQ